jgi:hypothetical protein
MRVRGVGRCQRVGRSAGGEISRSCAAHAVAAIAASCCLLAISASLAWGAGDANEALCPPATESSPGFRVSLPDCRAYELVSPPFTDGEPLTTERVAADGASVSFASLGGFGENGNDGLEAGSLFLATRGESGWATTGLSPSAAQFQGETPPSQSFYSYDFTSDFSEALFTLAPSSASSIDFRYYRHQPGGSYVEVGPVFPPVVLATWNPGVGGEPQVAYLGATRDLSHIVFSTANVTDFKWVWPGDSMVGRFSLYEYVGTGNTEPTLVGIKPGPGETSNRPAEHPTLISQCGDTLGGADMLGNYQGESEDAYNAISTQPSSEEGRTVFFTAFALAESAGTCTGHGIVSPAVNELYARISESRTVAISEPSTSDCEACDLSNPKKALFQGASADGSKVFFLSEQELFAGSRGEAGENLYEYDFNAADQHEKVSLIASSMAPGGGVMRVSEDGSLVYLVSGADLPGATANEFGAEPHAGADNLYVYDTRTARSRFIAELSPSDSQEWGAQDSRGSVEATPGEGRFLVFGSVEENVTPGASGGGRQLYRYDAQPTRAEEEVGIPRLVRISVGDVESNDGNDGANSEIPEQPYDGSDTVAAVSRPLSISTDGSKVFFQSTWALTPQALNRVCVYEAEGSCEARAVNVYEYEDGHAYLLSDGRDVHSLFRGSVSGLIGASASGSDVFFTGSDHLVGQAGGDTGQTYIYDARIDGGFPAPATPAGCTSECQGSGTAPPTFGPPVSTTLSGTGNVVSAPPSGAATPKKARKAVRCAKGRKLVHDKCVKARAKAKSRGRKARGRDRNASRSNENRRTGR